MVRQHHWLSEHEFKPIQGDRCFWAVVLKQTLESPLDCKEIKPVNPKGNQSWIFIRRTDAEAEAPIPWPPDAKSWLIRKDPDVGKDWKQKGMTKDERVGWHHWCNGQKFEQAPENGEGQGSLACCSPWGRRVGHDLSDWTKSITRLFPDPNIKDYWSRRIKVHSYKRRLKIRVLP